MPRLNHFRYFRYFRQITRVWKAPGNRLSRIKALLRAVAWTVQKRVIKHPLEIVVFTDRRFYCYPDGFIGNSIRLFSEWADYDSLHFIDEFLHPGDYFLDVGANVGLFTLLASRRIVSGGIVCVEPGRTQLARLREHLAANAISAEVFPVAVSDNNSTVYLTQGDAVAHVAAADGDSRRASAEVVQALLLDDFIPDRVYHLMKLDVEGFEAPALSGARRQRSDRRRS